MKPALSEQLAAPQDSNLEGDLALFSGGHLWSALTFGLNPNSIDTGRGVDSTRRKSLFPKNILSRFRFLYQVADIHVVVIKVNAALLQEC
jgi:hypothetical protein